MSRQVIKDYFASMRFSSTNSLGMGDIRLTIGQQERIEQVESELRARVAGLENVLRTLMCVVGLTAFKYEWQRAPLEDAMNLARETLANREKDYE